MAKKFYISEKFQKVILPILYFLLAVSFAATGCFVFYRTYYTNIYVSGPSMMPTLYGGAYKTQYHYGISDNHNEAIKNMRRFDVAITYYPSGWTGSPFEDTIYKIKRVWGFPGETISLKYTTEKYIFEVSKNNKVIERYEGINSIKNYDFLDQNPWMVSTFDVGYKSFTVRYDETDFLRTFEVSLDEKKQEYFLMGDNFVQSSDSYSHLGNVTKITYSNIQGRVIKIQGIASLDEQRNLVNKTPIRELYYF